MLLFFLFLLPLLTAISTNTTIMLDRQPPSRQGEQLCVSRPASNSRRLLHTLPRTHAHCLLLALWLGKGPFALQTSS